MKVFVCPWCGDLHSITSDPLNGGCRARRFPGGLVEWWDLPQNGPFELDPEDDPSDWPIDYWADGVDGPDDPPEPA